MHHHLIIIPNHIKFNMSLTTMNYNTKLQSDYIPPKTTKRRIFNNVKQQNIPDQYVLCLSVLLVYY